VSIRCKSSERYDVRPSNPAVPFQRKYRIPVNTPLLDESGHVAAILHHVEDVTPAAAILHKPARSTAVPAVLSSLRLSRLMVSAAPAAPGQRPGGALT